MAEEVAIAGTDARAKLRNPLGVVGLSIITLGIYYVFWWYSINREMRDFGRARNVDLGQSPGNSVLAITLGAFIIVPAIGPIIFVLLLLLAPVGIWYAQNELNKAWTAQSSGTAPTLPASEASAPLAPEQPAPAAEPRPEAPGPGPQAPGGPQAPS